jgi:transposase
MTGIAILEAILAGERNPHTLAALRDRRIKASADTIAKSLVGDYRREHLFTLRQSLAAFRHYQEFIADCDREIAQSVEQFESKLDPPVDPPPASPSPSNDGSKPKASEPSFNLQTHLHRIFGVDLPKYPESMCSLHKLFWRRSVLIFRTSPAVRSSPPGSDSVRTTG